MGVRIGGAFPFGQPELQIALGSGQMAYMPPGNWLVTLGLVSVIQSFDPFSLQWRTFGPPNMDEVPIQSDGYNWRMINQSGIVVGVSITNAGSGATNGIGATVTGVTLAFAAPAAGGQTATAYPIVGGSLPALVVAQAGSGFVTPPLILIDPPPLGGIQATAIATITAAGALNTVALTNVGAGYTSLPNVYVIPQYSSAGYPGAAIPPGVTPPSQIPPGLIAPPLYPGIWANGLVPAFPATTGALVNFGTGVLGGSGTLTGVVMQNLGGGYTGTTIPAITITGAGAAAATALMSLSMTGTSGVVGGAGYGAGAPPNWETSCGLVAQLHNNNTFLPRVARGVTTVVAGAVSTFVIEDPGFGFQKVPIIEVINTSAIATTIATATATVGGINDVCFLQPAMQ